MAFRLPDGGPVRVRTSITASETPTPAEIEEGEIALNSADGVLYFQNTSGLIGPVGFQDAPSDEIIYGRRDGAWVDITSPANLQVNRGTTAEVAAYTPLDGEPVWDSTTKHLWVGDGSTQGGVLVGKRTVASTPFPENPVALTSASYSTLVAVSLSGSGSVWHIVGTLTFFGLGATDANVQINLAGSGGTVLKGSAWINAPAGTSYKNHLSGATSIAVAEFEGAQIDVDYIVQLSSSTLNFGFPIRRTAGTEAASMIDTGEGNGNTRLYAQRLL